MLLYIQCLSLSLSTDLIPILCWKNFYSIANNFIISMYLRNGRSVKNWHEEWSYLAFSTLAANLSRLWVMDLGEAGTAKWAGKNDEPSGSRNGEMRKTETRGMASCSVLCYDPFSAPNKWKCNNISNLSKNWKRGNAYIRKENYAASEQIGIAKYYAVVLYLRLCSSLGRNVQ